MSLLSDAPDVYVLVNFATPVVRALRVHDPDAEAHLAALGITAAMLETPSSRLPHATWVALLELGCEVTKDPGFGMVAATMVEDTAMDLGHYLAGDRPTLRKVFMQLSPFLPAFHGGVQIALDEDAALTRCRFAFDGLASPPALMEYIIARSLTLGRRMLGDSYRAPLRVDFRHRRAISLARYEAMLGAPVRFGAEHDALIFPHDHFDLPVVGTANGRASMTRTVEVVATTMSFKLRARAHLLRNLENGDVSLEGVSAHLGLHPRTLRRRLVAEGTSHAALLDGLRQERALDLLREGRSISDTTIALGFSEPAAFRRAFRRWTGNNPSSFQRAQHLRPAARRAAAE